MGGVAPDRLEEGVVVAPVEHLALEVAEAQPARRLVAVVAVDDPPAAGDEQGGHDPPTWTSRSRWSALIVPSRIDAIGCNRSRGTAPWWVPGGPGAPAPREVLPCPLGRSPPAPFAIVRPTVCLGIPARASPHPVPSLAVKDAVEYQLYEQPWPEGEHRHFQLGFVVDDVVASATRWATALGIGPFHVLPRIQIGCTYQGGDGSLDTQIAVAQAGPVQIELVQSFGSAPNVYTDLVAKGGAGSTSSRR